MRFGGYSFTISLLLTALLAITSSAGAREKDAALVMDAVTGKVLYARNADQSRYPASLTKMMTLYVAFEAIEKGETQLYARINVSPEAASQKPTRLGLRAGDVLTVEDAIKALIIRSANDASVAMAEHLSGSEDRFADRMTQKARALGMHNTLFRNASGLPDIQQQTTAIDMATLSRRLQTDFPRFYPYFSQRSFVWNGRNYRGHNRLLNHFEGADGLKTGYTRLSGYNLATSASRRGTRLIGVVLGGPSATARDVEMAQMLELQFGKLGLGRAIPLIVSMSPLVPDEDEMDGAGSRQIVIEAAIDSRPQELAIAPAAANANAAHLSPILSRSPRGDIQPAAAAVPAAAPIGASMIPGGVRMSPVVPDDVAPERARGKNGRRPVSAVKPEPPTQRVAALQPAASAGTMKPIRDQDRDAIAGLINDYKADKARPAAAPRDARKPAVRQSDRRTRAVAIAKPSRQALKAEARGKSRAAARPAARTPAAKPAKAPKAATKPAARSEARTAPKADKRGVKAAPAKAAAKPAGRRVASR